MRKVSQDIDGSYPNLKELIADMFETLTASDGVGLAAPQVGLGIRLVVIDLDVLSEDLPEYKGVRKAYINPHILEYDDTKVDTSEEGCLSFPGIHLRVSVSSIWMKVLWSMTNGLRVIWHVSCSMSLTILTQSFSSIACHRFAGSLSRTS